MAKHFLTFLLIFGALHSKAENYAPTFRAVTPGRGNPFFINQLAVDYVGNTFWAGAFLGATASVGSLTVTNSNPWGNMKGCLFKLGPDLDERWAKSGSGSGEQGITGLAVDAQRDCYFAFRCGGSSFTFDNITYTSPSNQFTVVFKYSRGGNRIWSHQANGIVADGWAKALTVDSNTNVFFGGAFEDNRSFVRKLNSIGNPLWTRTGDKIQHPLSYSLGTDITGNCFMLSSFTNATVTFGDTLLRNRGAQSYVLVKYDPAGNVLWARRGGGNGPGKDYGIDLAVDQAGDVYVWSVVGSTNFLFGTNNIPLTRRNWVLAKYSGDSQPLWAKDYPVPHILEIGGISLDANGDILMSASSMYGEAFSSGFLAKCTPDGELVWTKKVRTGPENTTDHSGAIRWGTRLISSKDHNLYVTGANDNGGDPLGLDSITVSSRVSFLAKLAYDPRLSASRNGDWLTLSWPTNEVGFGLESSDNVGGTPSGLPSVIP